jgi:hypothetical protein
MILNRQVLVFNGGENVRVKTVISQQNQYIILKYCIRWRTRRLVKTFLLVKRGGFTFLG